MRIHLWIGAPRGPTLSPAVGDANDRLEALQPKSFGRSFDNIELTFVVRDAERLRDPAFVRYLETLPKIRVLKESPVIELRCATDLRLGESVPVDRVLAEVAIALRALHRRFPDARRIDVDRLVAAVEELRGRAVMAPRSIDGPIPIDEPTKKNESPKRATSPEPIDYDEDAVDDMVLALLQLTSSEQFGVTRAWKGFPFSVTDRLHERGFILDPRGRTASLVLTKEGAARSREIFDRIFGRKARDAR